jgi:hypothetical protein
MLYYFNKPLRDIVFLRLYQIIKINSTIDS